MQSESKRHDKQDEQPRSDPSNALAGRRILVVEDTLIVAKELARMLKQWQCEVIGPVGRREEALKLAQTETIDAVLLDVNLHGETSDDVAEVLLEKRVPLIFMTGYGREGISPRLRDLPRLTKPLDLDELRDALVGALAKAQNSNRAQPPSHSSNR